MKLKADDYIYLALRCMLAGYVFYSYGVFWGAALTLAFNSVSRLIMWYVFGLEALYPVDNVFHYDDEQNVANITSKISVVYI
jgi:hypothetical protein